MDSKPRKKAAKKGMKRKGKKIARGAKKIFETDIISLPRRPIARAPQQQQPVFNLNISQNLRNITGAFASASTAANYAKQQEINRQAAEASARAETITQLNRQNFLQTLEKQRLEAKVERGERAYTGAVQQSQQQIRELGSELRRVQRAGTELYKSVLGIEQPRVPRRADISSVSESSYQSYEGFSDMPPERTIPSMRVSMADVQMPQQPTVAVAGGAVAGGGGGSAYASEQYIQNQPRGRPIILDPSSRRTERPKRRPKISIPADLPAQLASPMPSGASGAGETTVSESEGAMRRRTAPAAASAPQKLRAAEIRKQLSAAAGVPQTSIRFATGKGSRKAIGGVDWVSAIEGIKKQGLSGAAAIEALKRQHANVLQ